MCRLVDTWTQRDWRTNCFIPSALAIVLRKRRLLHSDTRFVTGPNVIHNKTIGYTFSVLVCVLLLRISHHEYLRFGRLLTKLLPVKRMGLTEFLQHDLTNLWTLKQRFPNVYSLRLMLKCFINIALPSTRTNSNKHIWHEVQLMNNIMF
jgi:hypothetical protein